MFRIGCNLTMSPDLKKIAVLSVVALLTLTACRSASTITVEAPKATMLLPTGTATRRLAAGTAAPTVRMLLPTGTTDMLPAEGTAVPTATSERELTVDSSNDKPDYWPTDGWRASTPEEQGMSSKLLADLLAEIQEKEHSIDAVLVVRNGYLVLDAYVHPFRPRDKHVIRSCTKSIISALVGIAIDKGYIEGVEQPVLELFPERTISNLDAEKKAMTLEHVLMMATGLECRDSYLYQGEGLFEMRATDDWVQHMLDLPMAEPPGSRFEYCNGASFLLSAVIQEATGMSAWAFAEEHLFGPLGISDVEWSTNPQGIAIGWGQMEMQPHDMAKFGYLYLNDGEWDGEQIVPAVWVEASTQKRISATLQDGYGYHWWVDDSGVFLALGYGGQFIYVVPKKNMVVVFVSDLEERDFFVPWNLLHDIIIPAAEASDPLPGDPEWVALLESLVEDLANP